MKYNIIFIYLFIILLFLLFLPSNKTYALSEKDILVGIFPSEYNFLQKDLIFKYKIILPQKTNISYDISLTCDKQNIKKIPQSNKINDNFFYEGVFDVELSEKILNAEKCFVNFELTEPFDYQYKKEVLIPKKTNPGILKIKNGEIKFCSDFDENDNCKEKTDNIKAGESVFIINTDKNQKTKVKITKNKEIMAEKNLPNLFTFKDPGKYDLLFTVDINGDSFLLEQKTINISAKQNKKSKTKAKTINKPTTKQKTEKTNYLFPAIITFFLFLSLTISGIVYFKKHKNNHSNEL